MIKRNVTYKDFNDQEITEDVYFNLTEAEVIELNIRDDLEAVGKSGNPNLIMDTFKRLLKAAYGVRTQGGSKFVKTQDAWDEFISSEAYSNIFMEMVTDSEYASAFVSELIPKKMGERADAYKAAAEARGSALTPSEIARANSEANMQGHQRVQEPFPASSPLNTPAPVPAFQEQSERRAAQLREQQGQ